jgi:8-oxo-dGTP pyrophosphatase MutT (NUDIX family)
MTLETLIISLREYGEKNPWESTRTEEIVYWIEKYRETAFVKANLEGHITASMLIVNSEKTRVLLMFHKKLQMWLQFGGHCDGEVDTLAVAIREFHEESGISVEPSIIGDIYNVDIHDIPEHKWTPLHKHLDILYLGEISEDTPFSRQESEVDDIRWFDIEWVEKYIKEERMLSMIRKIQTL